jgi:uncharacterized protein (TIGR02757 family)
VPAVWRRTPPARRAAVHSALLKVERDCDVRTRLASDPVGVVRRYRRREDQEIVGLLASSLAFGNVRTIVDKLELVLGRLGPSPARAADDPAALAASLGDVRHRVYRGDDIARLLAGARAVQRAHGSLGRAFEKELAQAGTLRGALTGWTDAIRRTGGLDRVAGRRAGARHILADPAKSSGCKRLLLYLRWMVRPDDGVDLGLWRGVSPEILLVPVDTHIFKLARNLGFTARKTLTFETSEEVTSVLRQMAPGDPVRFDFALCHLGMVQRCPSRRDERRCAGCAVRPVCRHWARGAGRRLGGGGPERGGSASGGKTV